MSLGLDAFIVLLLLVLATWSVLARSTFAAVAGFAVFGLALTLAWARLQGVDIAMTEAAIGGGLTGVLLIGAAMRLRPAEASALARRPSLALRGFALASAVLAAAALAWAVHALPEPAPSLAAEAMANLGTTGVGNPVTGTLMAYRAMDTLLEAIVVFFALVGVWSLAPDAAWGGRPGTRQQLDPDGILAYVARVLPPIGIVVGIYIMWVGADLPGGKFQGATILAAMWMLVMMSGLVEAPHIARRWLRVALVTGPLVFVLVGLIGAFTAGAFLAYPPGWEKPLIVAIEVALTPSLAITLALLLVGAPQEPEAV